MAVEKQGVMAKGDFRKNPFHPGILGNKAFICLADAEMGCWHQSRGMVHRYQEGLPTGSKLLR